MFWAFVVIVVLILSSDLGRDPAEIAARKEREAERDAETLARRIEASKRFYSWPFSIVAACIWGFSLYVIFFL